MSFSTLLTTTLALMSTTGCAQYTLADDYMSGGNFFSKFSFFTAGDPTGGFVQYVDESTAQSAGYIVSPLLMNVPKYETWADDILARE